MDCNESGRIGILLVRGRLFTLEKLSFHLGHNTGANLQGFGHHVEITAAGSWI